jgi:molybdate transport system ATP-binding protein
MLLRCRIPLASFDLDIDVGFEARITAIFGPSGSGKTTLLDAIAACARSPLAKRDRWQQAFSTEQGMHLPARQRGIGYVP